MFLKIIFFLDKAIYILQSSTNLLILVINVTECYHEFVEFQSIIFFKLIEILM